MSQLTPHNHQKFKSSFRSYQSMQSGDEQYIKQYGTDINDNDRKDMFFNYKGIGDNSRSQLGKSYNMRSWEIQERENDNIIKESIESDFDKHTIEYNNIIKTAKNNLTKIGGYLKDSLNSAKNSFNSTGLHDELNDIFFSESFFRR